MFRVSQSDLKRFPRQIRYLYFVMTSVSPISYGRWVSESEPNPFVLSVYARVQTSRQEVEEIFKNRLR